MWGAGQNRNQWTKSTKHSSVVFGQEHAYMIGVDSASICSNEIPFAFAFIFPSMNAQAPAPAPTSDGTAIDQGVAYVLMVVALALTYMIH
ncbi:hypothetical protein Leryth_026605 [Lithospermum erythrorhizon]|nr:hypothetical protein Leryth_026605 [Lithospermum erythrorhizon]